MAGRHKILVVDDEIAVTSLLEQFLSEKMDCAVQTAGNGVDAKLKELSCQLSAYDDGGPATDDVTRIQPFRFHCGGPVNDWVKHDNDLIVDLYRIGHQHCVVINSRDPFGDAGFAVTSGSKQEQ